MSWSEAIRLSRVLARQPGTQIYAALVGWSYAASREFLALADVFDLLAQVNSKKKQKPYPRPWAAERSRTFGKPVSLAEWKRLKKLRDAGESREINLPARLGIFGG